MHLLLLWVLKASSSVILLNNFVCSVILIDSLSKMVCTCRLTHARELATQIIDVLNRFGTLFNTWSPNFIGLHGLTSAEGRKRIFNTFTGPKLSGYAPICYLTSKEEIKAMDHTLLHAIHVILRINVQPLLVKMSSLYVTIGILNLGLLTLGLFAL